MASLDLGKSQDESKVQAKFFSTNKEYDMPAEPILIPTALKKAGLTSIVNHLLGLAENEHQFEFLINGELVRSSLANFMSKKNLSNENIIEIEFIDSTLPPKPLATYQHDDWVSSCKLASNGLIITGCYDNKVRVWDRSSNLLATLSKHSQAIKSVAYVSQDSEVKILSASSDTTITAWSKSEDSQYYNPLYVAKGHTKSVEKVVVSPNQIQFATSSLDGNVHIYSLANLQDDTEHVTTGTPSNKKKKTETTVFKAPTLILEAHEAPVLGLAYHPTDPLKLYSAGDDRALRLWDLASATNYHTLASDKPFLEVTSNGALLATGSTDSFVRIWDPKIKEGSAIQLALAAHHNFVTALKFHPTNPHQLVSTSYDNTIKLWDLRSTKPLHSLHHADNDTKVDWKTVDTENEIFNNKVFDCDFDGSLLVSGGQDCKIKLHSI